MVVDPTAAIEQKQKLDLLSAQQVPTGVTETLTGPAIDDGSFELAAGGPRASLAELIGRLFGGEGLEAARRGLVERRQQQIDDPTAAPPPPIDPGVPPSAAPEVGVPSPEAPRAPGVEPEPVLTLSPEALDARVAAQPQPIRVSKVQADDALKAILEPRRTELLSDGLTDFRAVGARGDPKIPDDGNIHALIEHTSQTYKLEVDDATRGVITHAASQELADVIGVNPKQLMAAVMNMRGTGGVPIVEGAGISETILAVRNLLYTEVSKLDALAELAISVDGKAVDLLNFRQQLEVVSNLQTNFKGIQTEIGRSLGIFRVPIDHAHPAHREVNLSRMLDQFGGEDDLKALAGAYNALPPGRQRVQFSKVSRFKKFTNAAFEVWMNGLLSGPITHTKNFVAAGITVFAEIPVHLTAASIGSVRRVMGGEGGVTYGMVRARAFGNLMALQEAISAAGTTLGYRDLSWKSIAGLRTGEQPIAGSKLGDAVGAGGSRAPAFSAEGFEISRATASGNLFAIGVDAIGAFMTLGRIPTKMLGFEDTVWKVVAQRGDLWAQAFRASEEQGLKGAAAAEFMTDFMFSPPASAIKEADDLARKLTLQAPLDSELGKWVQRGARQGMMRWFIPFVKTPYNAFSFAFEHTPLAPLTKNFQDAMESGTRAQRDVAYARIALGSAGATTVGFMTAAGQVTGGGPADPGLRAALYRKGWKPYSVLINGTYYSYAGGEPYSTIIGLMADAVEITQTGLVDQDEHDELLTGVLFALSKNMSNKTFMQGFTNFMNFMVSGERYAGQIAEGFARTAVPILGSGIVRQMAQASWMQEHRLDPPEHEAMPRDFADLPMEIQQQNSEVLARYDTWAWLNSRIGELKANVPGWGDTPALRDFWGRKVVNAGAWGPEPMSPIFMSANADTEMVIDGRTYDTSILDDEMLRLKISQKDHPADYAGFPMNAAERDFFQERAGQLAVQYMTAAFSHQDYQQLRQQGIRQRTTTTVNQELKNMLQKAIQVARKKALAELSAHETLGPDFYQSYIQFNMLQKQVDRQSVYGEVQ